MTGVEIDAEARVAAVAAGTIWIDVVDAADRARPHRAPWLVPGRRRRRLLARRRHRLACAQARALGVERPLGRGRHRRGRGRPRRRRDEPGPLLGAPGRRRQLRRRHRRSRSRSTPSRRRTPAGSSGRWSARARCSPPGPTGRATVPEEVTSIGRMLQLPPIPDIPEMLRGRQVVVVEAAYLGRRGIGRASSCARCSTSSPRSTPLRPCPPRGADRAASGSARPGPGRLRRLDARHARRARPRRRSSRRPRWTARRRSSPSRSGTWRAPSGDADPNGGVLSHLEAPYAMYSVGVADGPRHRPPRSKSGSASCGPVRGPWLSRSTYFNFTDERRRPERPLSRAVPSSRLAEIRAEVDPDGLFRARHTI